MLRDIIHTRVDDLSEISRNIAEVFFASFVAGPLLNNQIRWPTVIVGLILSLGFWIISLIPVNKSNNE
jgi:hypothetical protein